MTVALNGTAQPLSCTGGSLLQGGCWSYTDLMKCNGHLDLYDPEWSRPKIPLSSKKMEMLAEIKRIATTLAIGEEHKSSGEECTAMDISPAASKFEMAALEGMDTTLGDNDDAWSMMVAICEKDGRKGQGS